MRTSVEALTSSALPGTSEGVEEEGGEGSSAPGASAAVRAVALKVAQLEALVAGLGSRVSCTAMCYSLLCSHLVCVCARVVSVCGAKRRRGKSHINVCYSLLCTPLVCLFFSACVHALWV